MLKFSDDPKITYAIDKLESTLEHQKENPDPDFIDIISHREAVLTRFQLMFDISHIPTLSKAEFESFLLYRNNHHWNNLHRQGPQITEDMDLLRSTLSLLLNEEFPIRERIIKIRPEKGWGEHSMVPFLGMAVLSAILLIAHPQKYGVWNNTSENGLKVVKLWKKKWDLDKSCDVYLEMNEIYLHLCSVLKIDLWTLDSLWWVIKDKKKGLVPKIVVK